MLFVILLAFIFSTISHALVEVLLNNQLWKSSSCEYDTGQMNTKFTFFFRELIFPQECDFLCTQIVIISEPISPIEFLKKYECAHGYGF